MTDFLSKHLAHPSERLDHSKPASGLFMAWHRIKQVYLRMSELYVPASEMENLTCGYDILLMILSPRQVPNTCRRSETSTFLIVVCCSFHLPDNKSLPAAYARAADGSHRLRQLHPVPLTYTWHNRLLYLQSLVSGLHGEPDPRPIGLPRCGMYHRASLSHQHRDVPGHESEVRCQIWLLWAF